jgi:hypothetical protein
MSLVIAVAALAAWAFIAFVRLAAHTGAPRLDPLPAPDPAPPVVAIIPARDEAETIGAARAIRSAGGRLALGLADEEARSLRDNRRLGSIWSMVARTAFTQLNHSWGMVALAFAGMIALYGGPPAVLATALVAGDDAAAAIATAAWTLMAFAYLPTARPYALSFPARFALPLVRFPIKWNPVDR